ncbi:hypothetical protein QF002_001130 [Paraburkholderia youngii]
MYPTNDFKSRGRIAGSRSNELGNTGVVVSGGSNVEQLDGTNVCHDMTGVAP